MTDIRFRRVQRLRMVPDVLRGEKDLECEAVQEIARREQARDWAHDESCFPLQVLRNVLELRDVVSSEPALLVQFRDNLVVLFASVLLSQWCQFVENDRPGLHLIFDVIDGWNGLAELVPVGVLADQPAPLPVGLVVEARVIGLQLRPRVQRPVAEDVDVRYLPREPRNLFSPHQRDVLCVADQVVHQLPHVVVLEGALEAHEEAVRRVEDGGAGLDVREVDPPLPEELQGVDQRAGPVVLRLERDGGAVERVEAAFHELLDLPLLGGVLRLFLGEGEVEAVADVLHLVERLLLNPGFHVAPRQVFQRGGVREQLVHRCLGHLLHVVLIRAVPQVQLGLSRGQDRSAEHAHGREGRPRRLERRPKAPQQRRRRRRRRREEASHSSVSFFSTSSSASTSASFVRHSFWKGRRRYSGGRQAGTQGERGRAGRPVGGGCE
mmetsp:Transcript_15131/g.37096  ORF Transcript_15131/g.37096 Transcript_15131/m.37096 type:complete len:437 (+) Transcript_15131:782-2092(+)